MNKIKFIFFLVFIISCSYDNNDIGVVYQIPSKNYFHMMSVNYYGGIEVYTNRFYDYEEIEKIVEYLYYEDSDRIFAGDVDFYIQIFKSKMYFFHVVSNNIQMRERPIWFFEDYERFVDLLNDYGEINNEIPFDLQQYISEK